MLRFDGSVRVPKRLNKGTTNPDYIKVLWEFYAVSVKGLEGSHKDSIAVLQGLWKSRTGQPRSIRVLAGIYTRMHMNRWLRDAGAEGFRGFGVLTGLWIRDWRLRLQH